MAECTVVCIGCGVNQEISTRHYGQTILITWMNYIINCDIHGNRVKDYKDHHEKSHEHVFVTSDNFLNYLKL